ncbi:hypothetical protein CK203_103978 [Vitis vinifera]|uniref:Retrotransposon gag domain-containing protein n=1 Tax=Vitis vinifera TaxID=29760 RepID=A0A438CZ55_VITVI|nr:hypothetical protein CK203_103978 [Vitis vinifera]
MRNVHSHPVEQPTGRNIPNGPPIGSISKRLDDMLSTPFCSHIINYEPPRGFLVPKFSTYDGTNDPFDHIMHYRQLMTLDIGNDAHCAKYFPPAYKDRPSHGFIAYLPTLLAISGTCPKLSWDNTVLRTAQAKYQHPAEHKMQDNESLREFVKRFGQAVLQVEACSMDAVLQIFKRSICPGTPFSNHWLKSLLLRWMTYSDEPTNIQCSKMTACPTSSGLDPLERTHPRDRSRRCAFHKDHGHTKRHGSFHICRSHPDTTTTSRRPHLVPGNWDFDVRRILVDPGSSADLCKHQSLATWDIVSQALKTRTNLSGFNGSSTTSLGDIILPVQAGPVTLNVQFSVVQELSPFNVILGRTWLHYMKAIPSTYHQMVSFLTNDGQIDLYGSQLAARQCYQIAREAGANQEDASPPEPSIAHDQ